MWERGPIPHPHPIPNPKPNPRSGRREWAGLAGLGRIGKGKRSGSWGIGKAKAKAEKARGIEGLESVEMGSAALRARVEGGYGIGVGDTRAATVGGTGLGDGRGESGLKLGRRRAGSGPATAAIAGGDGSGQRGSGVSGEEGWMRVLGGRGGDGKV